MQLALQLPTRGHGGRALLSAAALAVLGRACYRWARWCLRPSFHRPLRRQPRLPRRVRVAIVGAGVGGSALACWLRDLYGEDLDLTVVSDGPVGGRIACVEAADGRRYEGGAAIISELNEFMMGFMKRFGLKEKYFKGLNVPLGIFDGQKFVVREADPESVGLRSRSLAGLTSLCRMIRRYGFASLRRMKGLMQHTSAPDFEPLYRQLCGGAAFSTPEALVGALGPACARLTRESAADWFGAPAPRGGGLPANVVQELITGGMRANYGGQGCADLHALVGLVSVAGGLASRCFAVAGGNEQVPQRLMEAARPDRLLLACTARVLRPAAGGEGWEVLYEPASGCSAMQGSGSPPPCAPAEAAGPFDVVALAHPLERSCVRLEGAATAASLASPTEPGAFRRCVAHFLRGALRRSYFDDGGRPGGEGPPLAILTTAGSSAPFYSIGLQLPVDVPSVAEARRLVDAALRGEEATFKVFAPDVLEDAQLDAIFERRSGPVSVLDWYAYPRYCVPQPLGAFVLDGPCGSLLYLNAIEQAASAMEMSAVSARNAANLVVRLVDARLRA